MRIAVRDSGAWPAAMRRSKVSLRERPASTRRRVRSVATSVELPALEDARTETCTIRSPPGELTITISFFGGGYSRRLVAPGLPWPASRAPEHTPARPADR